MLGGMDEDRCQQEYDGKDVSGIDGGVMYTIKGFWEGENISLGGNGYC